MGEEYLYFGNLGKNERQYANPRFLGLALNPQHDREIKHDARDPLPFESNSIEKIQSQDVFEHLPYELIPSVLDDVYRVLKKDGLFRLSVPDYRHPLLKSRCVYNSSGFILADLMMGGSLKYNQKSKAAEPFFQNNGDAHVWFPTYEQLLDVIVKSKIRMSSYLTFHQGFLSDDVFLVKRIPDDELFVMRSVENDPRSSGQPLSLVVDFVK